MEMKELLGKVFERIDITQNENGKSDEIVFVVSDDEKYRMYHCQDCCEGVYLEDITGDINDLVGSPILLSEEVTNEQFEEDFLSSFIEENEWGSSVNKSGYYKPDSFTFTFYKFATIKGYVDIRWYGESNGYYSEGVDVVRVGSDQDWS